MTALQQHMFTIQAQDAENNKTVPENAATVKKMSQETTQEFAQQKQDIGNQFLQLMGFLTERFNDIENRIEHKVDKIQVQKKQEMQTTNILQKI